MADIDIVPKRGSSVWLWVVLALLALAVLFWFLWGGTNTATTPMSQSGLWESIPGVTGATGSGRLAA